jgi:hypothetical protein
MNSTCAPSTIVAILTGVASSFAASLVFIFFISRIRPKFVISKSISKQSDENGNFVFKIKFINKTRYRVNDVNISLFRVRQKIASGLDVPNLGYHHTLERIELRRCNIAYLEKYDLNDRNAYYAVRVTILENIEVDWIPGSSYYRLEVSGIHSLSGIKWCATRVYGDPSKCVKTGVFSFGSDLEVS